MTIFAQMKGRYRFELSTLISCAVQSGIMSPRNMPPIFMTYIISKVHKIQVMLQKKCFYYLCKSTLLSIKSTETFFFKSVVSNVYKCFSLIDKYRNSCIFSFLKRMLEINECMFAEFKPR